MGWSSWSRKKKAGVSLSLAILALFIYQVGSALLDMIQSLFNVNVPEQYYGILALIFIFASIYLFIKHKFS